MYKLHYCYVTNSWLMAIIVILLILAIFKFICEIAEEYISKAIPYIVRTLDMSDAVAGVTLLAFANGIGDVITALVASGTKDAVSYNVGALFGAGLFVMTVVVYYTIRNSPTDIQIERSMIYRDIGIYIIATLFTLYCAAKGEITMTDSIILLVLYAILVIVAVIESRYFNTPEFIKQRVSQMTISERAIEEDEDEFQKLAPTLDPQQLQLVDVIRRSSFRKILYSLADALQHRKEIREENEGPVAKKIEQGLNVIDYPFYWLRKLTIPPANEEAYNAQYLFIWPFFGIPFILWIIFEKPSPIWIFYIPFAIAISALFHYFSPRDYKQIPPFFFLVCCLTTIVATLWTKLVCEMLIDTLNFVGIMANLSSTYLGLTIIAIGSALPDALTTISIAKNGQAIMGLTGAYAGQIFGLLVGFGSSMLKRTIVTGKAVEFRLFDRSLVRKNFLSLVVVFTSLVVMTFTFGWNVINKFKFTRLYGKILLWIYIVFFTICSFVAFKHAFDTF